MIERAVTSLRLRLLDQRDRLNGRHDSLVPPRRLNFAGDSDFVETGDEFLELFQRLCDLQPTDQVLDVGCGIGRMARPLASYLRPSGSYHGFDVVPEGIEWCQARYAKFPNFHFTLANVANGLYRPTDGVSAAEYRFPYEDASFTFGFATSVFTHLLPAASVNYLGELARVLKPGGRLLATFFLLEPSQSPGTVSSEPRFTFAHQADRHAFESSDEPEAAVAYDELWVREHLRANDLVVEEPIRYGTWRGTSGVSLQDMIVASRPG